MSYDNNFNGYNYYPNNNFQRPIPNQYVFVNGVDGAKAYQVPAGQSIMLMDNDSTLVFMKTANQLGQTSIRYFKLGEITEDEAKGINNINYVSRSEFDEIKTKLDKLLKKKEADENV